MPLPPRYYIPTLFALLVIACSVEGPEQTVRPEEDSRAIAGEGYLGAESCKECHQEEYDLWSHSAHARAMTEATPEFVRGDFVTDTTHTYDGVSYTMFRRDESFYIRAPTRGGSPEDFLVHYTLGARQHETYLTRLPDGRVQVLPVYWDLIENRWYDAAEGTLEFGRALTPDDWLFWANQGRTWNDRCFDCHASQMRKNYDLKTDTYDTVVGDLSINCETCHGPGETHTVFWRQALTDPNPDSEARKDASLIRATSLSPAKQVEICAQCHATKTPIRNGYKPGDHFLDYFEINLLDDADSFWPDGLVKKLAYPYLQFAGSQCFQKADLTCTGCHANHGSDMPVELTADPGSGALCARCHPNVMVDVKAHTFHKLTSKGSDCKACHMPGMFLNYLTVTDHRLAAPVPEVTVRLGIPNSCNQAECHSGESAEWASEKAADWWGDYQTDRVDRAQAIAWGRKRDPRGLPGLIKIVKDGELDPLLRAGAVTLIGKIGEESALPTVITALSDTNQVVRSRAALASGAIGHPQVIPALKPLAGDSVYSVRIRAAFSLIQLEYVPPTESEKSVLRHAMSEHEATSFGILADSPKTHVNIGQAHEGLLQFKAAEGSYRRALRVKRLDTKALQRVELLEVSKSKYTKLRDMVTPHLDKDLRLKVALGIAKIHQGLITEGINLLREVKAQGIDSELVETGMADGFRRAGDLVTAERHYNQALEIFDKHANAHRGLAIVAYSRGDVNQGNAHWDLFKEYERAAGDPGIPGLF